MPPLSPPPPRRSDWVKNRNEEGQIKEMVVVEGDSSTINESIPVPDDLLFEILLRLPALDIYFGARLVCRKWYHMVRANNFVHKHLERSSYGLLYTNVSNNLVFLSAREDGGIDKINYPFNFDYIPIFSSPWNGLRLEYGKSMGKLVYYNIRNISTGQAFRLLPPLSCVFHFQTFIGYDAASMRYKVVSLKKLEFELAILTVGVDKSWRTVCADHLSLDGKHAILSTPIITERFVHWNNFDYSYQVVTLNLETETITETSLPIFEVKGDSTKYCCFSTGRYLSLFIMHNQLVWDVLEMKPETGEWRKLTNICLDGKREDIERLGFKHDDVYIRPYGWLKYPHVLALRIQRKFIIFYNLSTCEIGIEKFSIEKFSITLFNSCVTPHKNSLVSF